MLSEVARRGLRPLAAARDFLQLPPLARALHLRDYRGLPAADPGREVALAAAVDWLRRAQDNSTSADGGVARHFSLLTGWGPSYPETTGYIVPTMLDYAKRGGDEDARSRAKRMLDWLVSIQFPEGGFQGGVAGSSPRAPVTFNTGQILLGLSAGQREFGCYEDALRRAADWLVATQDPDGCWRKHPSPFAAAGEKTYDTHVAWGLLEAARITGEHRYADSALANVRWALTHQNERGWFASCCLEDQSQPLTHTLGYALRGVLEAHRFTGEPDLLRAARATADGLLAALDADGFLPGRLRSDWTPAVRWACLTGTVQVASCWLRLQQVTGEPGYGGAAARANRYVRRTLNLTGPDGVRGGIRGSFPLYGTYGRYQYLNWANKFFIDSQMVELQGWSGLPE